MCSDLCLLVSKTTFSCACHDNPFHVGRIGVNSLFCEGTALLAAYRNSIFIIGAAMSKEWTIREEILKIKDSVSALAYDSIHGNGNLMCFISN